MKNSPYHLFDGYGIELEYMIVDRDTLEVRPIADELLKYELGEIGSDFENGIVTWSNELVMHVIEIKSTRPESDLHNLQKTFGRNIAQINQILQEWNAMLLPTAAHPFMNPLTETKLWPHDNNEVYTLYNKIFNCQGHGWSNLQSTHLNLPFYNDEEFGKLHAAIRLILPLLPAVCASSPVLGAAPTGSLDTRLHYYKTNQAKLPSITGHVIPEAVFSFEEYKQVIYAAIEIEIAPYNEEDILDPIWVNSRGAIARFDRGSIEIRIMDIQECPAADLALIELVTNTLKLFVSEKFGKQAKQRAVSTQYLSKLFDEVIISGGEVVVSDTQFLSLFGLTESVTVNQIWKHILNQLPHDTEYDKEWQAIVATILNEGTLAERIIRAFNNDYSYKHMTNIYRELGRCLAEDRLFGLQVS